MSDENNEDFENFERLTDQLTTVCQGHENKLIQAALASCLVSTIMHMIRDIDTNNDMTIDKKRKIYIKQIDILCITFKEYVEKINE